MRLNEIKTVTEGHVDLKEGVIPVHILMTLDQVISAQKITNNVQYFIIGGLINMFKDGGPSRWPRDLNSYNMSTSSNLLDALKTMSDAEAVELATWLGNALQAPASFETDAYCKPQMDTVSWIKYVLKKQD